MKPIRLFAAVALCTSTLNAQIVTISSSTLNTVSQSSTAKTYTGLDGAGTSLTATATAPGIFDPGNQVYPGLIFGFNSRSAGYTFTFNSAVKFFEFYFTAQTTGQGFSEIFNAFATNGGSPMYTFTNVSGTAWDGTRITSTILDGRSILGITAAAGQSFTTISFTHLQSGRPNGSVIEQMRYELVDSNSVVPEPQTYLLLGSGLVALAGIARKRKSAAV